MFSPPLLTISETMLIGDEWTPCFTIYDPKLPMSPFLGVTALTGEVSEAHECVLVHAFLTLRLTRYYLQCYLSYHHHTRSKCGYCTPFGRSFNHEVPLIIVPVQQLFPLRAQNGFSGNCSGHRVCGIRSLREEIWLGQAPLGCQTFLRLSVLGVWRCSLYLWFPIIFICCDFARSRFGWYKWFSRN